MKWREWKARPYPAFGAKRKMRAFALFPRASEDGFVRWLEPVILHQVFEYTPGDRSVPIGHWWTYKVEGVSP